MRRRDERGDRGDLERRAERREDPHSPVTPPSPGRADTEGRADTAQLSAELRTQSLSDTAIILPLDAAIEAVAQLTGAGRRIESWEGWVKMRDGGRTRSLAHAGSFALPREPERAAQVAREGMQAAQTHWNRNPEYPGATLHFALTFVPVT